MPLVIKDETANPRQIRPQGRGDDALPTNPGPGGLSPLMIAKRELAWQKISNLQERLTELSPLEAPLANSKDERTALYGDNEW